MADTPFFRGLTDIDLFYALLLQTAVDWGPQDQIQPIADIWGFKGLRKYSFVADIYPPVTLIFTDHYNFIVSGSTHSVVQWIGNILGSSASDHPNVSGLVHNYFFAVGQAQYNAYHSDLITYGAGLPVVLIGFSLGSPAVTVSKALLRNIDNIDSACLAFASPRVGDPLFARLFPSDNFIRVSENNDSVCSVPPPIWSGNGYHSAWIPYSPFINYQHISPGYTLFPPGQVIPGDFLPPTDKLILDMNFNLMQAFHSQALYARIIRKPLPDKIPASYSGYANADLLDGYASIVFNWDQPWPFSSQVAPAVSALDLLNFLPKGVQMIQMSLYIRTKENPSGYQEVYYFSGTDPKAVSDGIIGATVPNILTFRQQFLSSDCEIYAARCSVVGGPRQSYLTKFISPLGGNVKPGITIMDDCITYFMYGNSRKAKRQIHFRGIPDTFLDQGNLTAAGQSATAQMETWLGYLMAKGMVINQPVVLSETGITGLTKAALNDNVTLNLSGAVTVPIPSLIEIRGLRAFPLLNGRWLTPGNNGVPGTSLVVEATSKFSPPTVATGTVKVLAISGSVGTAVTEVVFNGVSKRATGRQSFLRRGRRSAQIHHR